MTIKILAVAFLALVLTACESAENSNNSNENKPAASTPAQSTPAQASPAASPAGPVPATSTQLKAGDKVKVNVNGSTSEGTVVRVDEKAAKVTVKIQGQKEDKTVALSAVTRQ